MPHNRPPDDSVQLFVKGSYNETEWTNTFWVNYDALLETTVEALTALCTEFFNAFGTFFMVHANEAKILQEVRGVAYLPLDVEIESAHSGAVAGSLTGERQDAAVCAVVSWKDGSFYRGGKPRTYLNGIDDSQFGSARALVPGAAADLADDANGFLDAINAISSTFFGSVTLGCMHFMSDRLELDPPVFAPFVASAATVRTKFGTLRRRLNLAP